MVMFIIYVKDQKRSRDFYRAVLGSDPVLDVPGMTEFKLNDSASLGIMPEAGISKILGDSVPHPETGNGIPRSELYFYPADLDAAYNAITVSGGKAIQSPAPMMWGDTVAYGADPDGHIIACAKSPEK